MPRLRRGVDKGTRVLLLRLQAMDVQALSERREMRFRVEIVAPNGMPLGTCAFEVEHRLPEGEERLMWSVRIREIDGHSITVPWLAYHGSVTEAITAFQEHLLLRYRSGSTLRSLPHE